MLIPTRYAILILILLSGLIINPVFAVECYPPPEPVPCPGSGSLCTAVTICNNEFRAAYEPNENNKQLFEFVVRRHSNVSVRTYCEWKRGLVLPNNTTYCP